MGTIVNQDFSERVEGGITISRRPKRRASSENAPGPSKAIAAAITIISKDAILPSNMFLVGGGSQESAFARLTIAIETLTTGVRNPMRTQAPNPASVREVKSTANVRLPA